MILVYCVLPRAAGFPGIKSVMAHPFILDGTQLVAALRFAGRGERLPPVVEVLIRSARSRTDVDTLYNIRETM